VYTVFQSICHCKAVQVAENLLPEREGIEREKERLGEVEFVTVSIIMCDKAPHGAKPDGETPPE
jgi:hypothetical protein